MINILKILGSVFYLLSNIFLVISFLNYKKSDNKLNLIHWIFISIMLLFCYNAFIALVLSTLYIPVYLISVTICNIIIASILIIIKRGKKQEYFKDRKDIIATIILGCITVIISIFRFGIPFNIAYETCDPGVHFWTSKDFYEQSFLLNKVTDKTVVNFETRQAASYTNVGLMFKMASPFVDDFNLYIVYILYDIVMLFMAGMMFYIIISDTKSRAKFILSIAISILYFTGYPLNNMVFGFFYSGHAITLIATIYALMKYYDDTNFNKNVFIFLLALLCFGLFFTYYFYAPVVFIALFLYMAYRDVKSGKKIISLNFFTKNIFIFGAACLFGFLYYIVPNLGDPSTSISTQVNLDGYFYNNIFSNFTLLIPIIILSFIYCIKHKSIKLEHIMLIFLLIFMGIIAILVISLKAKGYYLSKNYYLLWLVTFIIAANTILKNFDRYKTLIMVYNIFTVGIIFLTVFNVEQKMIDLEEWYINKTTASNLFPVYRWNINQFLKEPDFNVGELKMLHEIYKMGAENLQNNASYNFVDRKSWLAAWFRKEPVTKTAENQLFSYLSSTDYIEVIYPSENELEYNAASLNYFPISYSNYNWFLIMYNKYNEETQKNNTESSEEVDYIAQGKKNYDLINRGTCINCTFYDFDDGLLIYKP